MASTYPTTLDAFSTAHADGTNEIIHASTINDLADAVNKIETELGTTPRTGSPNLWTFSKSPGHSIDVIGSLDGYGTDTQAVRDAHINALDLIKVSIHPTFTNGTNGTRGDSITSDSANIGAHSTWAPLWLLANPFAEKGSNALITAQATNNQPSGGGNAYNEVQLFFGTLTANRKGALSEAIEVGVVSNVAARAQTIFAGVAQNVTLAQYTTDLGAGSAWATTGARGIWILSNGSQAAGTGLYLDGNFTAGIRFNITTPNQVLMQATRAGEAQPRIKMDEAGLMSWSDGTAAADAFISRSAASTLLLTALTRVSSNVSASDGLATQVAAGAGGVGGSSGKAAVSFGSSQDLHLYRSAAGLGRSDHAWMFDGTVGTKVKAGAPVDGDYTSPQNGMIVVDSTNNKIWARVGGVWKGVVIA